LSDKNELHEALINQLRGELIQALRERDGLYTGYHEQETLIRELVAALEDIKSDINDYRYITVAFEKIDAALAEAKEAGFEP
jgi:hypothetical protein